MPKQFLFGASTLAIILSVPALAVADAIDGSVSDGRGHRGARGCPRPVSYTHLTLPTT